MSFDPTGMYVPRHELDAERARAEVAEARCRELAMELDAALAARKGADDAAQLMARLRDKHATRAERYRRRAFAMLRIARSLRELACDECTKNWQMIQALRTRAAK